MPELKLAKLPDRTPVKIAITVSPDLNRALHAYAETYRDAYGQDEPVAELIPFMLEAFLAGDRGFAKKRKEQGDIATVGAHPRTGRQPTRSKDASST